MFGLAKEKKIIFFFCINMFVLFQVNLKFNTSKKKREHLLKSNFFILK